MAKILIVDDENDLIDTLTFRLNSAGHEVLVARNGHEALSKTKTEKPDLIILDVMMPVLDGYQVCRMLKFDKRFCDIPIIMLTARGQDRDKLTGYEVGADDYVTKPFDGADLLKKITKLLEKFSGSE